MKRISLFACSMLLGLSSVLAQESDTIPAPTDPPAEEIQEQPAAQTAPKQKKSHSDKIFYGGYFNFSFSKDYNSFGVEPMIGYKLIPRLSVGAKFRYDYINYKRYDDDSHSYGASIFSRLMLIRGLYAHVEYAGYNYELHDSDSRKWEPFLLLGAGFNQRIGARTSLNAQVLFNVLKKDDSLYGSQEWWREPYYSVGVAVGF